MRFKIYNDNKLTVETLSKKKPRNTAKSVVRRKAEKENKQILKVAFLIRQGYVTDMAANSTAKEVEKLDKKSWLQ